MVSTMAQSMYDMIAFLYPEQADDVSQRLQSLLDDFKARYPTPAVPSPRFTAEDGVLICYADHVHEEGKPTLQTMHRFLDQRVEGYLSTVHFLPFYPYSSDDGFSVIDYYRIKDEFGDWDDVKAIAQDFSLMFDLVINHISAKSEWFQKFLAGDPKYQDYFISFEQPVDVSSVFRPRTHPLLTRFQTAKGDRYVWTTFSEDQIDVNFANPDVLLEYVNIILFYVDKGARVLRLDAIAYLWKQLGTSSIHLPQTHMVVKLLRRILEEVAPEVWIITETNVPHKENISYFGNGEDEAHLVYNFALPPLLIYTLMKGDATELTGWAKTLDLPSKDTAFFNFTASHDGVGVTALRAMISPDAFQQVIEYVEQQGARINYRTVPGQDPVPYELNVVYLNAAGGVERFIVTQAIALALQGVPGVYFNSLIGAENWEEGVEKLGYNRAINRQKFNYHELSHELDDPDSTKHQVYEAYTRLLHARRGEPLFSPLAEQAVLELDPRVFAIVRSDGNDRLLALANVSHGEVSLDADKLREALGKAEAQDILSKDAYTFDSNVTLKPYQIAWLK
jgi:glucosylglycerate phosphorylase